MKVVNEGHTNKAQQLFDLAEEISCDVFEITESMDYIEGQSLADVIQAGPLPARKAAEYVKTIAEAIHFAHQHGKVDGLDK